MQKRQRASSPAPAEIEAKESEYVTGALVRYYEEGYRYGHIIDDRLDDDGNLSLLVQPIGAKGGAKQRALWFVSTDLEVQPKRGT
jgi:hypothetical protein